MICKSFNSRSAAGLALAAALAAGSTVAVANEQTQAAAQKQDAHNQARAMDQQRWAELREQTVSAEELMGGDVVQVATIVGSVRDLVLNEDGTALQYVLYEVPYPYAFSGSQNGFVAYDNVELASTASFDVSLRMTGDQSSNAPEELTLNRREADHRLVSNILDQTIVFSETQTRPVEDLLIDRQTGEIKGYVVNRNEDAWFNDDPRVIPPDQVTVDPQGNVTTQAEFAALESIE